MNVDRVLEDLLDFARIEIESHDVEPWAEVLRAFRTEAGLLGLAGEEAMYWLVKGYNAFDGLASAFAMRARWASPDAWQVSTPIDRATIAELPCTNERRGLRGGRVMRHYDSYVAALGGMRQADWIRLMVMPDQVESTFLALDATLRTIWGVGRQTSFEWIEFLAKVCDVPARAPHAMLWESEGPRRSLERIYNSGEPADSVNWLDEHALGTKAFLANGGVELSWEDFETIICDFNVMRDGRYYPGRHLAALLEEITEVGDRALMRAWDAVVPEPWRSITPGIDKAKLAVYRDTGTILDKP